MTFRYFAYGSNMNAEQMARRCPSARLVAPARLEGFRLAFTRYSERWGAGVADVVPDLGFEVWGLLYELGEDDLVALDRCEGHPTHYVRGELGVAVAGEPVQAQVYTVREKDDFHPPAAQYLAMMIAAAEQHRFPPDYLALLRAVRVA